MPRHRKTISISILQHEMLSIVAEHRSCCITDALSHILEKYFLEDNRLTFPLPHGARICHHESLGPCIELYNSTKSTYINKSEAIVLYNAIRDALPESFIGNQYASSSDGILIVRKQGKGISIRINSSHEAVSFTFPEARLLTSILEKFSSGN